MAGVNAGDGQRYISIQGSAMEDVENINTRSNIGKPGVYVFRTDPSIVSPGPCELSLTCMFFRHVTYFGRMHVKMIYSRLKNFDCKNAPWGFILTICIALVHTVMMFPFGGSNGDTTLATGDDANSGLISLSTNVVVYDRTVKDVIVCQDHNTQQQITS